MQIRTVGCAWTDILACEDFGGGVEPRIGTQHIHVIAIDGFPRMGTPGIMRELDALAIEYRWNTRAILLEREEGRFSAGYAPQEVAFKDFGLDREHGELLETANSRTENTRRTSGR